MKRFWFFFLSLASAPAHAGLDVTAYEKLELVASAKFDADGLPVGENVVQLVPLGDFQERFAGLTPEGVYHYRQSFDFRAGSYSGYNAFRNQLAKFAGYVPSRSEENGELRYDLTVWNAKSGPFWELIDFSDAEGVIGPLACKRVALDFHQFEAKIAAQADEEFLESYRDWQKAFDMCANDGAIEFH